MYIYMYIYIYIYNLPRRYHIMASKVQPVKMEISSVLMKTKNLPSVSNINFLAPELFF